MNRIISLTAFFTKVKNLFIHVFSGGVYVGENLTAL